MPNPALATVFAPLLLLPIRRRLDASSLQFGGDLACGQAANVRRRVGCQFVGDAMKFCA